MEKLKENDVTLIVSDWMMPRMDGVELCKALRADQAISHIPFILLTAKTDTNSKIEGMDCGRMLILKSLSRCSIWKHVLRICLICVICCVRNSLKCHWYR
ncbi:MAG: response regulator [Bacteroides cellulosilyticus]